MSDQSDGDLAHVRSISVGPFPMNFACAVIMKLGEQGVEAFLVDTVTSPCVYMPGAGPRLMIKETDAEKAAEIIRSFAIEKGVILPDGTPTVGPEVGTWLRGWVKCLAVGAAIPLLARLLFGSPDDSAVEIFEEVMIGAFLGAAIWFAWVFGAGCWRRR